MCKGIFDINSISRDPLLSIEGVEVTTPSQSLLQKKEKTVRNSKLYTQ